MDMKLGIYGRVSMRDQNIETQLMPLREFCARQKYPVIDEYLDNGVSGKKESRPEFDRLMADVRNGRINYVLIYKLDRIGRSLQHLLNILSEFKNLNVELKSYTQNLDTSTPEGRMFWKQLAVFAEYERELIVARTQEGLARAIKQGKQLGRPKGSKDKKLRRKSGYHVRWANGNGGK